MSDQRIVLLIWTLLALMALGAWLGTRRWYGAVILALASFAWLLVDTGYEGITLWAVTRTHGLTTSDLVGVLGLLVALGQLWRLRRAVGSARAVDDDGGERLERGAGRDVG